MDEVLATGVGEVPDGGRVRPPDELEVPAKPLPVPVWSAALRCESAASAADWAAVRPSPVAITNAVAAAEKRTTPPSCGRVTPTDRSASIARAIDLVMAR